MKAIFNRELRSYFSSPVGYVCIAALACLYGFFYLNVMLYGSTSYIPSVVFSSVFMFNLMVIPIITMRTLSEDKKNKTDQALLTAPIGVTSIVLGKFLAAFTVFGIASLFGVIPAGVMESFSEPPWGMIVGNFAATLLYGSAMIAIGIFISSLTESQVIAAIGTFVVAMLLLFMGDLAYATSNVYIAQFVAWISFTARYNVFSQGIFNIPNMVFFLSVTAIFIFLTARKIESRRWN